MKVECMAEARARRGLTVPILALASGVSQDFIQAAERGERGALTDAQADRLAAVLGVDRRVLEVPTAADDDEPEGERVLEAASPQPEAPWRQAARRAGVDIEAAFGEVA